MALSPDGRSLFTANQRALATDDVQSLPQKAIDAILGKRERVRLLRYGDGGSSSFEPFEEFFYLTERTHSVTGIIALSNSELLVLEKGERRIFRVSLDGAEDVSRKGSLAASEATALEKELLVDVDDDCPLPGGSEASFGLLEGIALGPELPDGRQTLLLVSDDDFDPGQKTRMITLGIRQR